jgi:hypothetical protein
MTLLIAETARGPYLSRGTPGVMRIARRLQGGCDGIRPSLGERGEGRDARIGASGYAGAKRAT